PELPSGLCGHREPPPRGGAVGREEPPLPAPRPPPRARGAREGVRRARHAPDAGRGRPDRDPRAALSRTFSRAARMLRQTGDSLSREDHVRTKLTTALLVSACALGAAGASGAPAPAKRAG